MSGESLERYFRLVQGARDKRPSGRLWCPAADVLRISGSRRDGTCGEGISHYQLEITYSRFEKMIKFPRSIEQATIERNYHHGLLILHLIEEETGQKGRASAAG